MFELPPEDFLQKPRRGEPPTVKAVVHNQYNSPLHLYSQEKVAETLAYHAQALATEDGLNNIQPVGLPQNLVRSAVLQALNEETGPNPYRAANGTTVVQRKTAPPTPPPKPRPPSYGGGSPQQERSYSSTTHVTFSNPGTPGTPPIQQPHFYSQAQQPQQPAPYHPPTAFQSQHSRQSSYEEERRRQQVQEAELRQRLYEEERLKQAEYEEERFRQLQEQRAQKLQQIQQPQDIRRYEDEAEQRKVQEEIERRRRVLQEEENRRKQEQLRLRQEQEQQRQRYLQEEEQRRVLEQQRQKYLLEEQERRRQLEQQKQRQQQQYQQQEQQQQPQQYQRYLEEQRRAEEQRKLAEQRRQQEAIRQRQFEDQQRSHQQTQRQPVSKQWSASEPQQRQYQPIPVPSSPQHQEQVGSQAQRWEGKIRQEQQSIMPGTPIGSPSVMRRSRDGCWPPKESSVRWTPKTGFSPHLSRQSSHESKQFVWPPPKSGLFNGSEGFPSRPSSRNAINAWHPPSPTSGTRTPPFAQSPTLGRRTRDIAWPPPQPESSPKFVPKPVSRGLHEPQEFLHHHASSGVPATYRPPPNSSQFL